VPLGDVGDRAEHELALGRHERVQPDLDRNLRAVLAQAEELAARGPGCEAGIREEAVAAVRVVVTEARRDQHLDRLADQFHAAVAEQPLDLAVDHDDRAGAIGHDHPAGRRLDRETELLGRALAFGDVHVGSHQAVGRAVRPSL
jgi:hypothetical protein